MPDIPEKDMQSIIDKAWRDGFEAGMEITLERLDPIEENDEYEDVELHIGDIVQTGSLDNPYYIVCKIEDTSVVAVDPTKRQLVSFDKDDIVSVGKLLLSKNTDESL